MPNRYGTRGRVAGSWIVAAGAAVRLLDEVRVRAIGMMIVADRAPVPAPALDVIVPPVMRARENAEPSNKQNGRNVKTLRPFCWASPERIQVLSISVEIAKETMPAVMQITARR